MGFRVIYMVFMAILQSFMMVLKRVLCCFQVLIGFMVAL